MADELKDRYGEIPAPLINLLRIISLKCLLTLLKIKRFEHSAKQIIVHITEHTPINMKNLLRLVKEGKDKIKLLPDGRIIMDTEKRGEDLITFMRNVLMQIVTM